MKKINCLAAAAVTLLFAGCYRQAPLEAVVPAPATRIVAIVTDSGAAELGNTIGPGALEVEGVVTEADANTWKLQMLRVDDRFGKTSIWQRQEISFPRYTLTRAKVKNLDKTRSFLAAGGIVAGAILGARLFTGLIGDEPPDTTPVPQATRLAPLRVR